VRNIFRVAMYRIINTEKKMLHGKNGFAKVPKNLARYRFENNFIEL